MNLLATFAFISLLAHCSARVGNNGTNTTTTTNSTRGGNGSNRGQSRSSWSSGRDDAYFLVDPSKSDGRPVSSVYAQQGYESDHYTNCTYRLYGVPDKRAAGDRDMLRIATSFKQQFNKLMQKIDPTAPIVMTRTEITAQQLGGVVDKRRRLHTTAEGDEEHSRDLAFVPYSYGFMVINYVCRGCNPDNKDKRRHLQAIVNETKFVQEVSADLKQSKSQYIGKAIESTSCLRIQCEGGDVQETDGCSNFPLE